MFDILKRGKSYYCAKCLFEKGKLVQVPKKDYDKTGVWRCEEGHTLTGDDVIVMESTEWYCPKCLYEGNMNNLKVVTNLNGKILGYYCFKHKELFQRGFTKGEAEAYLNSLGGGAQPSKSFTTLPVVFDVQNAPMGLLWFILYVVVGLCLERFAPVKMNLTLLFFCAGITALIMEVIKIP